MNKKGYDMKTLMMWVIALFFFVLMVVLILARLRDSKNAEACYSEDLCVPRADGCPLGSFDDGVHKCADDETNICCLTLEDKIKYGKSSGEVPVSQGSGEGITPVNGNINLLLGASSSQVTGSKTLTAGNSYTFRVSVDGSLVSCSVKIMDVDTLTEINDPSWIQVPSSDADCKSGVEVILTPKLSQVNKAYRMEVKAQDSSKNEVKMLPLNLNVISPIVS